MAKNPAVLFYTSDFLTGTYSMSDAAVGRYIKLLCLQHQQGHLPKKEFFKICKKSDTDVISKFEIDEDGCYFNERMDKETRKRQAHSEKQRANVMKRWNENGNAFGNTTVLPLENENENIYILEDKENRGSGGKEKKKPSLAKGKKALEPPTLDEVVAYCKERGNSVDPKKFFDYFSAANWTDSKGQKVKSWKQKVITWESYSAPREENKHGFIYDDSFEEGESL